MYIYSKEIYYEYINTSKRGRSLMSLQSRRTAAKEVMLLIRKRGGRGEGEGKVL